MEHALSLINCVHSKIEGHELDEPRMEVFFSEVLEKKELSYLEIASFLTACRVIGLNTQEIFAWTRAMVNVGQKLHWGYEKIIDKHCVGGVPGNRTTPIVVSIIASCGLIMPKTSSRAITSPSGTADTMEVLTEVNLSLDQIKKVVAQEGACLVWGGGMTLSPADKYLIAVEKKLKLNLLGQMVASILSKKVAAGSTHLVIDLPVSPVIKINSELKAQEITCLLESVAQMLGLHLWVLPSEGHWPVGRGVGAALEIKDVLAVLENNLNSPLDLKEKSLTIAGKLLELSGKSKPGEGFKQAEEILLSGQALKKFYGICEAQGGIKKIPEAKYKKDLCVKNLNNLNYLSLDSGIVSQLAKILGAPEDKTAGVEILINPKGEAVTQGQAVMVAYSATKEKIEMAEQYFDQICWD